MPDDRFFHKSLGHSQKVNSLTDFEDLVWRSYVLAADDFGIMRFSAITLRADNDRLARKSQNIVERALHAVFDVGLIATFEHQGRVYCFQRDWQDWQKVTYPKRTVNPQPPPDVLITCTDNTRWLFSIFPGGVRIPSWKCPESFRESFQNFSSLARGGAGDQTRAMTSAKTNGSGNGDRVREPSAAGDPELADRAGRFVELYGELFAAHRKGARYHSRPSLDFQEAVGLCTTWDDERLKLLAIAFLTTDDTFCRNGNGSIAQFRSRASWCDAKLRESGL